jgi:diketogulonate reductase-like aldo/keto reductase
MNLPKIGFGTWQLSGKESEESVGCALDNGYRLIDTAKIYGNETEVGRAIASSKLNRDEVFVTSKLWTSDFGYDEAKQAFSESLARLGLGYMDLYLIHWPGSSQAGRHNSWRALEEIKHAGRVAQIGVSNFNSDHLRELSKVAKIKPYVNQIELHPFIYEQQRSTLEYCQEQGILVEAYSPLAQANNLKNPIITEVADIYKKTPAQVMLRWAIQKNTTPIPRSSNPGRIKENFDVFDFELQAADMNKLDTLSTGKSALG